jgi:chaperonin GroES
MTAIRPVGDRYLLIPEPPERVTQSGYIIPEQAQKPSYRGMIVAIGPQALKKNMDIGSKVIFSKFAAIFLILAGRYFAIIREHDLIYNLTNRQPAGDRLELLPDPADKVSKGGIILPASAIKPPRSGKIVSMGNNTNKDILHIEDKVLFSSYSATFIDVNGEQHAIVRQHDISAII